MLFFPQLDYEILEISGAFRKNPEYIIRQLDLELRLIISIMPSDEFIIISPTFLYESDLCRKVIYNNKALIEAGYIRLLMREDDLYDVRQKKKDTYKRVRRIEKYKKAYFEHSFSDFKDLNFHIVNKTKPVGKSSLAQYLHDTHNKLDSIHKNRLHEFLHRIGETETESFLWESAKKQIEKVGLNSSEQRLLNLRQQMSQSYLKVISLQSEEPILLPYGSSVMSNNLICTKSSIYDLIKICNIFKITQVFESFSKLTDIDIVNLNIKEEYLVIKKLIRTNLELGKNSEEIIQELRYAGLIEKWKILITDAAQYRIKKFLNLKGEIKMENNKNKVFVVHGRDSEIRNNMFNFLRAIGVEPLEWQQIKNAVGPSAYIGQILNYAFENAQAVIVLMTPDDEAKLKEKFIKDSDEEQEKTLTPQARANVIFEAGMSLGKMEDRTIIIQFGKLRKFTDLDGRHIIKILKDTPEIRISIVDHLKQAGVKVEIEGKSDWIQAGNLSLNS